jgi:hypothetical protein
MRMLLATVKFGAAADRYDEEFWDKRPSEPDSLFLRAGRSPAEAIAKLHPYATTVPGYVGTETETRTPSGTTTTSTPRPVWSPLVLEDAELLA